MLTLFIFHLPGFIFTVLLLSAGIVIAVDMYMKFELTVVDIQY